MLASVEDRSQILPRSRLRDFFRRSEPLAVVLPVTESTCGMMEPRKPDALLPGAMGISIAGAAGVQRLSDSEIWYALWLVAQRRRA